jgi:catechol 2,3-dioxygenase-like lactoylglutathione lyase family enzyme
MAIRATGLTPLLQVYDMPQALTFYQDVLGFEIVDASPQVETPEGCFSHWMLLRLGPAQVMLNTAYDEGQRPGARVKAQECGHGDICLFFSCDDADAVYSALRSKISDLKPPRDAPYGMRQLYFRDPDGYGLCFQAPIEAHRTIQ